MSIKKMLFPLLLIGLQLNCSLQAEGVDLKREGAFGFPQAQARVLYDQKDLRVSVWGNAEYLYVQAIVWADGDDTLAEISGRKVGDFSQLLLDIDADQLRTPTIDRTYTVGSYPNVYGLRYQVVLSERGSTPLQADSKGRGSIKYLDGADGQRIRVDSFLIPLTEIGKRTGETIRLAYFTRSPQPELILNSVDFESTEAYGSSSLPRDKYHELMLAEGAAFDSKLVPEGREEADLEPSEPVPVVPELTIGSRAPALDIEHWVQNGKGKFEPVTEFASGKAYIVEFWATWCGPCIAAMPHIAEIQNKYADQGLQVVSISDEKLEIVQKFLEKNAPSEKDQEAVTYGELTSQYCLTTDPDGSNHTNYMKAARRNGIPCAFVVGKSGHIEWIGHPMSIDKALASVVAGDWDREAFAVEYKQEQEIEQKRTEIRNLAYKGKFAEALAMATEVRDSLSGDRFKLRMESSIRSVLEMEVEQHILKNSDEACAKLEELLEGRPYSEVNMFVWRKIVQVKERGRKISEEVLATATRLTEKLIDAAPETDERKTPAKSNLLDTYAHLLNLQGQLDKAIEVQQRAVNHAQDPAHKDHFKNYLTDLQELRNPSQLTGDLLALQGEWRVTFADGTSNVIDIDHRTFTLVKHSQDGMGAPSKFSFAIDENQSPKQMTWRQPDSSGQMQDINRCIYELHGDTWLLIGGLKERPSGFVSGEGKPHTTWILKREKAATGQPASDATTGATLPLQNFTYPPVSELKARYFPSWLAIEAVQKDLELTPEQIAEVAKLRSDPPGKKIPDILTNQQSRRLDQIYWHFAGGLATRDPEVAKSLGLSEEQATRIEALGKELADKMRSLNSADYLKSLDEIRQTRNTKVAEILTKEQNDALFKLRGEPFDIALLDPPSSLSRSATAFASFIEQPSIIRLLLMPTVQADLKLDDEIKDKLKEFTAETRKMADAIRAEFPNARGTSEFGLRMTRESAPKMQEMQTKRAALEQSTWLDVRSLLSEEKNERLVGLAIQRYGVRSLSLEPVAELLELNEEQKEIVEQARAKFDEARQTSPANSPSQAPTPGQPPEFLRKRTALTEEGTKLLELMMTDQLRSRMEQLKGAKFDFPQPPTRPAGPGGFSPSSSVRPRTGEEANVPSLHELRRFEGHKDKATFVCVSPDGRTLLSSSDDKTVRLWDLESGKNLKTYQGHESMVLSVAFLPDGKRFLSSSGWPPTSQDHSLRLWEVETGKELWKASEHKDAIWKVAISADGSRALSASRDKTIGLWDLKNGTLIKRFSGHDNWVRSVAFVPNQDLAVSGGWDRTIRVWDLSTGQEVRRLVGHEGGVEDVDVSPDGKLVVSCAGLASRDNSVRLWDLQTGGEMGRMQGHTDRVWTIAFSPDGGRLLSGGGDQIIRLWDVPTRQLIAKLEGHTDTVRRVAFTADSRFAVSASHDTTIRLWQLPQANNVKAGQRNASDTRLAETLPFGLPKSDLDLSNLKPATVKLVSGPNVELDLATFRSQGRSVTADYVPTNPALVPLITAAKQDYVVVDRGLQVGAKPYTDRAFKISELPDALRGLPLVQTKMGHKGIVDGRFSVVLSTEKPCYLFVAIWDATLVNYASFGVPFWLQEFSSTEHTLLTDNPIRGTYRVFVKLVPDGRIALGPCCSDPGSSSMYFAFAAEAK